MNTAEYRKQALAAEQSLNYGRAAAYWELALTNYPQTAGALAERDRARIAERARECLIAAQRGAA
jgi:hypothetical protein